MASKPRNALVTNFLLLALCAACSIFTAIAHAQSTASAAHPGSEMDAILFVQSAQMKNGENAIQLAWIPQPLQRLCLGKTLQRCADIDYCIRTTNREVSMCRNLGIPLSQLPSYPAGMVPRRQHSIFLLRLTPDRFANLQDFYHHLPPASLERLSLKARVKARVRYTVKPDDDDFDVLEILAVAPF